MTVASRLESLRAHMQSLKLDAIWVPRADEFLGEYVPIHNERLAYLTGFTGSAGVCVVTMDAAILFVDGRYTLQAANQCPEPLFEHQHIIETPPETFLRDRLSENQVVGVDARCLSFQSFTRIEQTLGENSISLSAMAENAVDLIWTDRPVASVNPIILLDEAVTGASSVQKRAAMAESLKKANADAVLLTQLDSIAWTLNIRGDDVPHLPVLLAYAIMTREGDFTLFTDTHKLVDGLADHVGPGFSVLPIDQFDVYLKGLSNTCARLLFDPQTCHAHSPLLCRDQGIELIEQSDPAEQPKACKNATEVAGIRRAHVRDGVALCRFLAWLDGEVASGQAHDEGSVSDRLEAFRRELPELKDLSFSTISAAGPNAAMAHYSHTNGVPSPLVLNSVYLVDSGGQYLDGTTDVTRTIAIGEPSDHQKEMFTRVLKGHIALSSARFPRGTAGNQLDVLARQFLWEIGKDYDHGTGHGVGCYLSVHEGPQRIGKTPGPTAPLKPGMVVSNEPGYYEAGAYGIRCENLLVVVETDTPMLAFEPLTLAPFDRRLILVSLLSEAETQWIDDYHAQVREQIGDELQGEDKEWLQAMTAPLAA